MRNTHDKEYYVLRIRQSDVNGESRHIQCLQFLHTMFTSLKIQNLV